MTAKYIFLDRDGVINKDGGHSDKGYITCWENFEFIPGVVEAIKKITTSGYKVIVISNQQGVAKGCYAKEELDTITENMTKTIRDAGGDIEDVYYCTHLKEENCDCRKPKPGLFLQAKDEHKIEDLRGLFFIGDTESDVQVGQREGLRNILVLTGKNKREDAREWFYKPDYICEDLMEAVDLIMSMDTSK